MKQVFDFFNQKGTKSFMKGSKKAIAYYTMFTTITSIVVLCFILFPLIIVTNSHSNQYESIKVKVINEPKCLTDVNENSYISYPVRIMAFLP